MVRMAQRLTSRMKGSSLRPCTTASLCMRTMAGMPPTVGSRFCSSLGRWKVSLSQLPGRFCVPRAMEPSRRICPGQAMPMKGARLRPSSSQWSMSSWSIAASRSTSALRVGLSSAWRHFCRSSTLALDRSAARFRRSLTMPQRRLVPPMSTARMASWWRSIAGGTRCTQPISPPSSTSCDSRPSGTWTRCESRITDACRMARSPTSLSGKPPPITTRSTPFHDGSRRNRRVTCASSMAKSSITPRRMRAASPGLSSARMASSSFFAKLRECRRPNGSGPSFGRSLRACCSSSRNAVWLAPSPMKPSLSRNCRL